MIKYLLEVDPHLLTNATQIPLYPIGSPSKCIDLVWVPVIERKLDQWLVTILAKKFKFLKYINR